jgi:beta-glucosidase
MTLLGFPDGFLWGTATSSHQVEGDNSGNDWWDWEAAPGHIHDGVRSGRAAEWWHGRAEEDLERAAALGQNAHRLSLEWSRLEPAPGHFDDEAFARYRSILKTARGLGMTTMVTLNHFTLPRWVSRQGSWTSPFMAHQFGRLARRAAAELGDDVDLWATLNEPNVLAYMGYAKTEWPPGVGRLTTAMRALGTMLRSHAAAYQALREVREDARVGIVLSAPLFAPARAKKRDALVARGQAWAFYGAALHAIDRGTLLPPIAPVPEPVRGLARSFDWLGLNYYGRYEVRFDPSAGQTLLGRHVQVGSVRTDHTDWGQPSPSGLASQLRNFGRFGVPVYVTENGVNDPQDAIRPRYLVDHVRAVHEALGLGVDVRGYFHWSLVDNFEWAEGWAPRFGLFALDRDTQERTPRASAQVYAAICRSNGVPAELPRVTGMELESASRLA